MVNSQELANKIKSLAKTKKIAIGKMLSDCNLSVNTLSSMQSGGYYPRLEALAKIADCLGCSVDYLLGRTENPEIGKGSPALSENEKAFINAYRNKPEMQPAVDKLLGIDMPSGINIAEDIAETVKKTQQATNIKCNSHSE